PRFDPAPHLPRLLAHPEGRVRMAAVRLVRSRGLVAAAAELEALLAEEDVELTYEAALALGAVDPERARAALSPHLATPDHPLAGAAIAALLPAEEGEGEAFLALRRRLEAEEAGPEHRRETVRALGKL